MRSATNNWDFWTSLPEALHQVTIVMSDRGIPASYRHMHGFGSHTFSLINAENERFWVKFHLRTQQGIKNLTDAEAEATRRQGPREPSARSVREHREGRLPALDDVHPDHAREGRGEVPLPSVRSDQGLANRDYPLIEVGVFELNRNPENYFAEVEQAAFNPANIVPGIGFSPDKMLQGRLFSYGDAQRYRLGVNHHLIPVNAPRCPVHSYHRDGADARGRQPRQHAAATSRTATASGASSRSSPSRHWAWRARPTAGTSGKTTMTTTASRANCSG